MSNLPYKNPISPLQVYGSSTVDRSKTFGTNFSVLGTGGFMEVYSLSDLNYIIPIGETGNIEFSGNTIPVQFKKGTGSVFSPDVLTLNSDNISSGRRRLGMLVYVYETNKIYQHSINDYDNLWSAATGSTGPGGNTVIISDFGTTIKNNSVAGQNLINAWTASTIEGIDGYTNLDATWRELKTGGGSASGDYLPLSGGTVTGSTNFTDNLYVTGSSEVIGNQIVQSNYDGPFYVSKFKGFSTGATFAIGASGDENFGVSNDVLNYTENGYLKYNLTASDIHFNVVGNLGTFIDSIVINKDGSTNIGGDLYVSNNLSANTISATTYYNLPPSEFTGGTVNGETNFTNGLTANTISATTYQNLPIDPDTYVTGFSFSQETYVLTLNQNTDSEFSAFTANLAILASDVTITGGTYDSNTGVATFTNNSGASFDVSGFTSGLTDTVITAFTYSSNTFTIKDSSGSIFDASFNTLTGLTVNGTISATTYGNLPNTLYTGDGTLQNNRIVDLSSFTLNFSSTTNPDVLSLNNGSIGVGVSNPNSSSVFEISSTTKGFLGPRMSETERLSITSPAAGLVVYQTDNDEGYYIHKSFGWVQII